MNKEEFKDKFREISVKDISEEQKREEIFSVVEQAESDFSKEEVTNFLFELLGEEQLKNEKG